MDHGQDLSLSNSWLILSSDVELALKTEIDGSSRAIHEKMRAGYTVVTSDRRDNRWWDAPHCHCWRFAATVMRLSILYSPWVCDCPLLLHKLARRLTQGI